MKNCICKIYKEDGTKGTGFFCNIPFPNEFNLLPVLATNNHILEEKDIKNNKIIEFTINDDKEEKRIIIDKERIIFNCPELDITLIEIKPDKDNIYNFLEIDENINKDKEIMENFYRKKSIYTLNYPKGKNIVVSYGLIKNIENEKILHLCNTEVGSSGSPILLIDSFKIIGVHKRGNSVCNFNEGIFFKYAIDAFNKKFKNISNNNNSNYIFENKAKNEIKLKYMILDYDYLRIFSKKFVENNKQNCKLVINEEEKELSEYIDIKKMKIKNNILKIKLKEIKPISDMSYMFYECRALSSIKFSKWNSNNILNMKFMFSVCTSLISIIDISKLDTSKVISMKGTFQLCQGLMTLPDISNWNTNNVTDMSYLFNGCSSLISLPDISKWDISNVTNLSVMFQLCSALTSLPDISKWNTKNVQDMSYIFSGCSSLSYLPDISKWNTNNVNKINDIFFRCSSLISIPDISKWNTNNVVNMSGIFYRCHSLKSLPDISKWNTSNVKEMSSMFFYCTSLISLPNISKWNIDNLIKHNTMFSGCKDSLNIPKKFQEI